MRSRYAFAAGLMALANASAYAGEGIGATRPTSQGAISMNINLTINGQVLSATLENNVAAQDFLGMLPLTLELEDYASTEKIAQLPRKLSTAGEPPGITPSVGDITYYAPWGNLAVFYKGFGHADGLVKLGHITSDIQVLRGRGPLRAHIEVAATR